MENIYSELPHRLLPWFSENARLLPWRENKNPYRVWLSEIMLQQTRVEAVRGYFLRFVETLPDIVSLAEADENMVLKLWEGLGYYSRAKNLQKAAKIICEKYGGVFPTAHKDILLLPGIGDYTAGAIASICFNAPTPAVDGNVLRVAARICDDHTPINSPAFKKEITLALQKVYPNEAGDFTQSLMELGALVCTPKSPKCSACPLSDICLGNKKGTVSSLPVKTPKKARRIEEKTVFYLECNGMVAVRKRGKRGLLANLWEFPNMEGTLSSNEAVKAAEAFMAEPEAPIKSKVRTHIFTHIEWRMTCYYIPCRKKPSDFVWVSRADLTKDIALPTAFRMFLEED